MDVAIQDNPDVSELGPDDGGQPASWQELLENVYLVDASRTKNGRVDRKMRCECELECDDEGQPLEGCGEECINRLLMIECHPKTCPCGDYCMNQCFQKKQYVDVAVYHTGTAKGWGLRACQRITAGAFVREYVGEVCSFVDFQNRTAEYHEEGRRHHYFMTLRGDQIIDATLKGSVSRFMNHCCEPNCETQKWMVNGRLRVGFFAKVDVEEGEELTFDYQFERMGEGAQECFCGAPSCSGFIGGKQQRGERSGTAAHAPGKSSKRSRPAPGMEDELTRTVRQCCRQNQGLVNEEDVILLSRVMVTAESSQHRLLVLDALTSTKREKCLRMFLKLQGLSLLWSWMVDLDDSVGNPLALRILETLEHLPVMNRNILKDSKVLGQVTKWSEAHSAAAAGSAKLSQTEGGESDQLECSSLDGVKTSAETTASLCSTPAEELSRQPDSAVAVEPSPAGSDSGVESPLSTSSQVTCSGSMPAADRDVLKQKAERLLEKWSELREVYRIPKKAAPTRPSASSSESLASSGPQSPSPTLSDRHKGRTLPFDRDRERHQSRLNEHRQSKLVPQSGGMSRHKRPHSQAAAEGRRKIPALLPTASSGLSQEVSSLLVHPSLQSASSPLPQSAGNVLGPPPVQGVPIPLNIGVAAIAAGIPPPPIFATANPALASGALLLAARVVPQLPRAMPATTPTAGLQASALPPTMAVQPYLPVGTSAVLPRQSSPSPGGLPAYWQSARDDAGRLYYYHTVRRESQWDFPTRDDAPADETPPLPTEPPTDDEGHTPDETPPMSDDGATPVDTVETAPVHLSPPKQERKPSGTAAVRRESAGHPSVQASSRRPTKRIELTPAEIRQVKDRFRADISGLIVQVLHPYSKPDCKVGRIGSKDDFKFLARKLSFIVLEKELQQKSCSELEYSASVRTKTEAFIRSYMKKVGLNYVRS